MTPTATARRPARRLTAGVWLVLIGLAPASAVYAQRGPAKPASDPSQARPAPAANPVPAAAPGANDAAVPSDIPLERPDLDVAALGQLLGDEYESKGQGIALRPPKDSVAVRRAGGGDFIEFVNREKGWTLKLSKIKLTQDGSLTRWADPQGNPQPGVLEHNAKRLKEELPDAEFLRQDVIHIGPSRVGMLVLRHERNLKPLLSQQAIIEKNEREYYLISLTTPGAGKGAKDAGGVASGERVAVETFSQILDSVRLLSGEDLRAEQDARLFASRTLMTNLLTGQRVRSAIVKEQWRRVLKDGKDVGYAVIFEYMLKQGNQDGVEIAVRSRTMLGKDVQLDSGSVMFASMDMRHEDWSTLTDHVNLKQREIERDYKPAQVAEFGVSLRRAVTGRGDDFTLQVTFESTREQVKPVARDLPPFYLSQAYTHLLPRLVPLNERKQFLFTTWVPESKEVILRYVDVGESKKVNFNGELVRCVPVEERIGIEGAVTTHFVAHDGTWLGSENKEAGLSILPTTEAKLLELWKDAILDRPDAPERDARQVVGPPAPREGDEVDADADAPRAAPRVGDRRGTTGTRVQPQR